MATNIHDPSQWTTAPGYDGKPWHHLDLSGAHLGVRIERLQPGEASSVHHYHSAEEEHLLILEGTSTLIFGESTSDLHPGDHVCFLAGDTRAHHLENRSGEACLLLVFGERRDEDVVFYPDLQVLLTKHNGVQQFTYRPIQTGDDD